MYTVSDAAQAAVDEVVASVQEHGGFKSRMDALAVLEEEVDEFKYEIRHGTNQRALKEACQVAAMALKFMEQYQNG